MGGANAYENGKLDAVFKEHHIELFASQGRNRTPCKIEL
jgi:hypothetical protein